MKIKDYEEEQARARYKAKVQTEQAVKRADELYREWCAEMGIAPWSSPFGKS